MLGKPRMSYPINKNSKEESRLNYPINNIPENKKDSRLNYPAQKPSNHQYFNL